MDLALSTMSFTLLSMQLSPETAALLYSVEHDLSVFIGERIRLNCSDEVYIVKRVLVGHA